VPEDFIFDEIIELNEDEDKYYDPDYYNDENHEEEYEYEADIEPPNPGIHGKISRVEYNGNVAYIFGTLHHGRPHWFPLHPIVTAAMYSSDVFAFETDLTPISENPEAWALRQYYALLPEGMTLREYLPEDVFDSFYTNLRTWPRVSFINIAHLKPDQAIRSIVNASFRPYVEQSYIFVDNYIEAFALEQNKSIIPLIERLHSVSLSFFRPLEIHIYLASTFPDWNTAFYYFTKYPDTIAIEQYEQQDIDGIISRMHIENADTSLEAAHMRDVTATQRSGLFASKINQLLTETEEPTTFFVAIGIAHLTHPYTNTLVALENYSHEIYPLWHSALTDSES